MQAPVEIHYAGVVVARAESMREVEGGDLFIATKEPLPVGTLVGVSTPEAQFNVRVAHVVETVDGADNGMRVRRLGDGDPGANLWVPPPPAKPAPAPERPAAPVAREQAPETVEPAPATPPEVQAMPPETAPIPEAPPASAPAPETSEAAPVSQEAAPVLPEAAPEKAEPAVQAADDSVSAAEEIPSTDREAEQMPLIADLPPARRTQGGTARRRTKKRK